MQLPEFIQRMLGFTAKVEGHFDGADKLAAADKTIADQQKQLATLTTDNVDLHTKLDAATGTISKLRDEIDTLTKDIQAAKAAATATIAAQGLDPALLPAAGSPGAGAGQAKSETPFEKWTRLQHEDPREAGAFWRNNTQAILDSRPKVS